MVKQEPVELLAQSQSRIMCKATVSFYYFYTARTNDGTAHGSTTFCMCQGMKYLQYLSAYSTLKRLNGLFAFGGGGGGGGGGGSSGGGGGRGGGSGRNGAAKSMTPLSEGEVVEVLITHS